MVPETQPRAAFIPKALLGARDKPFLIWAAPPFLLLYGVMLAAFSTALVLDAGPGTIAIAGTVITKSQYLLFVFPVALMAAAVRIVGAYGLAFERTWGRSVLTKWTLVSYLLGTLTLSLGSTPTDAMIGSVLRGFLLFSLLFWYFYWHRPVARYYKRLGTRQHAPG